MKKICVLALRSPSIIASLFVCICFANSSIGFSEEIVSVKKIGDSGKHNAFLIVYEDGITRKKSRYST